MAFITLQLPEMMDPVTARVFRTVLAQLDGVLSREHNYDGTHGNVTARSIDVEENPYLGDPSATGIGSWLPYLPEWTTDATQPSLGNGELQGWFALVGRTCHFRANLKFGSTTNPGTGTFGLTLPLPAEWPNGLRPRPAFPAWTVNFGGAASYQIVMGYYQSETYLYFIMPGTSNLVGATIPAAWAANDELVVSGTYEIA